MSKEMILCLVAALFALGIIISFFFDHHNN